MTRKRLGLIVNPIAGMGGPVGLKGTDGETLALARARGGVALAEQRAGQALAVLAPHAAGIELLTAAAEMGEAAARDAEFQPLVICASAGNATTADDTRRAAAIMRAEGVDLILFAGGDGTARDIFEAVGASVPVLGIPAGVKMHSAVFATNPRNAGRVAAGFLGFGGGQPRLGEAEIMDRDPGRAGGSARLYGFAQTPHLPLLVQHAKAAGALSEDAELDAACAQIAALARDDRLSIIGPGTTMQRIKRRIGFAGTLLGVDAVRGGRLVAADRSEAELLGLIGAGPARIIVGIVGGQGYLFGRGNQPISAKVIERVGRDNIVVVAAMSKLLALGDGCLHVDTGDEDVDRLLGGYIPVVIGPGRRTLARVAAA